MTTERKKQDGAHEADELAVFDEPVERALAALSELCAGMAEDVSLHERVRARADAARTELDEARGAWYRIQLRFQELQQGDQHLAAELQGLRDTVGAIARSFEDEEWPSGV